MVLQNKSAYPQICLYLLSYMKEKWPVHLTYHTLSHIIDVANVCNDSIEHYSIHKEEAKLLRIAAIGHDIGYLISPENHEEQGILTIRPFLENDLTILEIETINNLIRATKVPQRPVNFLQEVLADADLDYLGRDDYDSLSSLLYQEFLHYEKIKNETEWLNLQINFLENHSYHTSFAKKNRSKNKMEKLKELKLLKFSIE